MAVNIKGMSSEQGEKLQNAVRFSESRNNYRAENKYGYIGAYQFGAEALQSQGLIKPGIETSYSKIGAEGQKALLNNPSNWTIPGGKEAYLSNTQIQDESFQKLANSNYNYLEKKGVISSTTDPGDVGGYLAASHLKGAGNAAKLKDGVVTADANNTTTASYYGLGKSAVNGTATSPLGPAVNTSAGSSQVATTQSPLPSWANEASPTSFTGQTGISSKLDVFGTGSTKSKSTKNILEQFSSYNYIFTLSCLPPKQINFPDAIDSYKNSQLGVVILRSTGGIPNNSGVSTAYAMPGNPQGKYEYFIDNIIIESTVAHDKDVKGTNVTGISFDINEPYSMGMFVQTLDLASAEAGYTNYRNCPYLLTVEFVGYDSEGNILPVDDELNRHFPIVLTSIDMSVSNSGSKYSVKAIPWNELAFTDMNMLLKEDMNISGETVAEILQTGSHSLQYWLNAKLQHIAKLGENDPNHKTSTPDEIVIMFPQPTDSKSGQLNSTVQDSGQKLTSSAADIKSNKNIESKLTLTRGDNSLLIQTADSLNDIGKSSMNFNQNSAGQMPLPDDNKIQSDPAKPVIRKQVHYTDKRSFQFPQGTTILSAIEEIVLMSGYCSKNVNETPDSLGMINWFRIETQVYILEANDTNVVKGHLPKLMIFKVVPYKVHKSIFMPPTARPSGYNKLKNEVAREYNYVYTGKNTDIINFNISFPTAVFFPTSADKMNFAWQEQPQSLGVGTEASVSPMAQYNSIKQKDAMMGTVELGTLPEMYKNSGGSPNDTYKSLVARTFHYSLVSAVSTSNAEIEIWGDPYYLADSGMGNYNAEETSFNITADNTMNYQNGEVDILINYKTPIDYDQETGIMKLDSEVTTIAGFSGLYKVNTLINTFSKGKFTQKLSLSRRAQQDPQEINKSTDGSIKDDGKTLAGNEQQVNQASSNAPIVGDTTTLFECTIADAKAVANNTTIPTQKLGSLIKSAVANIGLPK